MQTSSQQGASAYGARSATDWHALEVQLNRTRTILQEILVHLQEVLRNLKKARSGFAAASAARGETGFSGRAAHETRFAGTAGSRTRASGASSFSRTERTQTTASGNAGAAGDRFRSRSRRPFESHAETHAGPTGTAGEKRRFDGSRFSRTETTGARTAGNASRERSRSEKNWSASSGAAGTSRDRTRTESTWRSRPAGAATAGRDAKATQTGQRAAPRQTFRMDAERQRRARVLARKNGMNLKCAYDILCLDYPCSADEIKCAYRHMARLHHPDLGGDEEAMKDVNVAYELAMRFCAGARRTSTAWAV